MNFLMAFLVGGGVCALAQLLLDGLKILPIYVTILFVTLGAILEGFGVYDILIKIGHAGAMVPISSFGHSLTHGALASAEVNGYLGLLIGVFDLTASGITATILFSFFIALIFKPKG